MTTYLTTTQAAEPHYLYFDGSFCHRHMDCDETVECVCIPITKEDYNSNNWPGTIKVCYPSEEINTDDPDEAEELYRKTVG